MQLKIEKIINSGMGLGHYRGKTVFVPGTVEDELVEAEIVSDHRDYSVAKLVEVLTPSPHRIAPPCKYYLKCGGCSFQHVNYPEELRIKKKLLIQTYFRNGKIDLKKIDLNLIPSPYRYNYRRKITVHFGWQHNCLKIGFNYPQTNNIISIDKCLLAQEDVNDILIKIHSQMNNVDLAGKFTSENQTGRLSIASFIQGTAVIVETEDSPLREWLEKVLLSEDEVKSFFYRKNQLGYCQGGISKLNPGGVVDYEITPTSFFQINQPVADKLLDDLKINIPLTKNLYDIYCGAGVISLYLSELFEKVVGIDSDQRAVMDAAYNAMLMNKNNIKYYHLTDREITSKLLKENSTAVLDPPRSGINSKLINLIILKKIKYLVYISCNPATQARDIDKFQKGGYRIAKVRGYDMFPLSPYLESVVYLTYCGGQGGFK